ncbi:MAG: nucleotide-binding protein [Pyrinomonadaceae bacterium]
MKPRVFIGSSTQGLPVAEAIQKELAPDADVTAWSQGLFRTINVAIEDLMTALNEFDFAIFVFLPEDTVIIREQKGQSVRDNVLFELGLFLGKLGRQRNFFVAPKQEPSINLHLPSDLSGITPASYDPNTKNLQAAVGPALYEIKQAIRTLGMVTKQEVYLYDSKKDFKPFYFAHKNGCIWKGDKKASAKSEGSLQVLPEGVLKIQRENLEGRYEIEIRRDGLDQPSIKRKHEPINRVLRVNCEARVDKGDQAIRFVVKNEKAGKWMGNETRIVNSTDWATLEMYFRVLSTVDLLLRIDIEQPSQVPSNLYLRNLVITEEN